MTERVQAVSGPAPESSSGTHDRAPILRSAMMLFSRSDYDQVTLGMVAREAGLSEDLATHHFGTKEGLFTAAVETALADILSSGGAASLCRSIVDAMACGRPAVEAGDPVALILRGAANARALPILRSGIEQHFERPSAGSLTGADGDQRATLLFAVLAGFQVARTIMDVGAPSGIDPAALSRHLAPVLEMLIDPPEAGTAKR